MLSEISDMEGMAMEELVSCNNDPTNIAKGKRTKRRLRPLSPCVVNAVTATAAAMTSSCSSASGGGGGSFSSITLEEEEEDMANCLILLAQGRGGSDPLHHKDLCDDVKTEKGGSKIEFYVYECKTCNRTFPSFQALGGHRASHKKPKVEEKKSPPPSSSPQLFNFEETKVNHMKISPSVSLQLGCGNNRGGLNFHGNKSKIHECSICGSEFTSGQALGGHMRRHRSSNNNNTNNINTVVVQTTTTTTTTSEGAVEVKPRSVLQLDLNLPAPEDDLRESKFQFSGNQNSMMLSAAPALVGCHY
ncbi:zinc finger protein 1 [Vigna radiata var. radiata]|uniref:Zinc finger protein 1 n=1 Tax=Vigna radiata var. radiata TaxID=3916 RepID=A0A1S3TTL5_VIGRR|nr:zinc finger protein 1 [Vigna radiata var. radiata]